MGELGALHVQTRTTRFYLEDVRTERTKIKGSTSNREHAGIFRTMAPANPKVNRFAGEIMYAKDPGVDAEMPRTDPRKALGVIISGGGSCSKPGPGGLDIPYYF